MRQRRPPAYGLVRSYEGEKGEPLQVFARFAHSGRLEHVSQPFNASQFEEPGLATDALLQACRLEPTLRREHYEVIQL